MATGDVRVYYLREMLDSESLVVLGLRRDTSDAASRIQIESREFDMKTENRTRINP